MKFSNILKRSFFIISVIQIAAIQNFIYPDTKNTHSINDKVSELDESIDGIVSSVDGTVSIQVVSADKYDLIYEHNSQLEMIPASITKLVTSSVAFDMLGINYDFKTIVYTDDQNISDGVIDGNIYLKGYGDPDLNSLDIAYLAEEIRKKGIIQITGNIVYDESYLDDEHYSLADYYQGDTKKDYWPYVSGLNFNKNPKSFDPALMAGTVLKDELVASNIIIDGIVVAGMTPSASKEIAVVSHSIFDVLAHMNKESDNHSAITVFKVIGAKYSTPPGTISKGESAVVEFLTSIGNQRNRFEILEGSGLSRFNRVNSDMYIRLLKYMYDKTDSFDYFYSTLPIAGEDGTLRNRMIGTEAQKNVHAKTGTLNSVSALSGYAVTRDSELLMFYIVMNGFGGGANGVRYKQDQICELLCQFSRK
ncbi:MAG: D-alanyl-D-alanine carboxypeptidase/D-alanyl-D-alanine-endopeptidase [Ignavibacteriae bacterium]|nr:D-alanyl-D-alanine carboxypeptidase/D-alanyl-D-alanine-endopeptidase [Ignavibacteriota bacterium]